MDFSGMTLTEALEQCGRHRLTALQRQRHFCDSSVEGEGGRGGKVANIYQRYV